ncbi:hypothetical protein CO2235_180026 [Cupriavidus oxalaticus]|uniref:Uncharacterized protein n=1 Tax=Cupriavidus oxalaticus TaxID=96344 RepID=A0A375G4V9_9BURK|nr:hypothetical protein CO2235_180026 [Cupriavidus oxalaticus]
MSRASSSGDRPDGRCPGDATQTSRSRARRKAIRLSLRPLTASWSSKSSGRLSATSLARLAKACNFPQQPAHFGGRVALVRCVQLRRGQGSRKGARSRILAGRLIRGSVRRCGVWASGCHARFWDDHCIKTQYIQGVPLKFVGGREKGNLGNLRPKISRKALPDKGLRASAKR